MQADQHLATLLTDLVDRWCDRRALAPLRCLLPAWPSTLRLSDDWHALWLALRNVSGLGSAALTTDESRIHSEALRILEVALRSAGQDPLSVGNHLE